MIVMNAGVVEQVGAPMAVYDAPASLFVAGFIGSPAMNFLPGSVRDGRVDVGGGHLIALPRPLLEHAPAQVTVGIRPEHLVACAEGDDAFTFPVETIEALGADSMVHGKVGATPLVARVEGHAAPAIGSTTRFALMPGRLHFFDTVTGRRLVP